MYFLVFHTDPHCGAAPKVIAVQVSRVSAEASQLTAQQQCADRCNNARAKAFHAGRSSSAIRTASDFVHEYSIQEVTNP